MYASHINSCQLWPLGTSAGHRSPAFICCSSAVCTWYTLHILDFFSFIPRARFAETPCDLLDQHVTVIQLSMTLFLLLCCVLSPVCSVYGIEVRHMWGMTELSPLGSIGVPTGVQLAEGMSKKDMLDRKVEFASVCSLSAEDCLACSSKWE
eukprot:GHUV01024873.1.p1 GENE.GHUV01024873.1~~GHUV01024873.1.p1  ORF type:complete len:151 (+),score=11.87 GHUV01024873.1:176-628(+)